VTRKTKNIFNWKFLKSLTERNETSRISKELTANHSRKMWHVLSVYAFRLITMINRSRVAGFYGNIQTTFSYRKEKN